MNASANYDGYKRNFVLFMDKNKIVKKLYLLGIVVNCYLFYQASEKYLKIRMINQHIEDNTR